METTTIKWSAPYTLDRIHVPSAGNESGIYHITKRWGERDIPIYIGQAYRQTLVTRIRQHNWLIEENNLRVRFGIEQLLTGQHRSAARLDDIEALLIVTLEPRRNEKSKQWYYGRELRIINLGMRGPAPAIVSTADLVSA